MRGVERPRRIRTAAPTATELARDVTVTVRLLGEPALWYWEVYDQGGGRVRANSWIDDATGYPSKSEALAAGLKRASRWSARPMVRLNGISLPPVQRQNRSRPWRFVSPIL